MPLAPFDRPSGERRPASGPGVLGVLFCPDGWLARPALDRLLALGAAEVLLIGPGAGLIGALPETVRAIAEPLDPPGAEARAINRLIAERPGRWIAWCRAAEFLFYPFCETRSLGELTSFLDDERRRVLYAYTLDLYAPRLPEAASGLGAELFFDARGYYGFPGPEGRLDLFGGLGWRFEELLSGRPEPIGRPALFRAEPGVEIGPNLGFSAASHASVACPWHHNPTGAVMSLARARLLLAHPGFTEIADRLIWAGSHPFAWSSRQLLELGMIEPGQWF